MERSPLTIGKRKFARLSVRRRHRLLADLALEALARDSGGHAYRDFLSRYAEFHSWAELDRYTPPPWLAEREALEEFIHFHHHFAAIGEAVSSGKESSPTISWQPRFSVEVVLDQVRSPYNVGSVLRLIDNFGFQGLVHGAPWMNPVHPQLRRAARGCEEWIPFRHEPDLPAYLEQASAVVTGIEHAPASVPVSGWHPPPGDLIMVLGNETYGIAAAIRDLCRETVFVPMHGFKKSMNVHHALAVVAQRVVESRIR